MNPTIIILSSRHDVLRHSDDNVSLFVVPVVIASMRSEVYIRRPWPDVVPHYKY